MFLFRELKEKILILTRCHQILKDPEKRANYGATEIASLEQQYCAAAGFFLFYGISIAYDEEKSRYGITDPSIGDQTVPIEIGEQFDELTELVSKRRTGTTSPLEERRIVQLTAILQESGYDISVDQEKAVFRIKRYPFSCGVIKK